MTWILIDLITDLNLNWYNNWPDFRLMYQIRHNSNGLPMASTLSRLPPLLGWELTIASGLFEFSCLFDTFSYIIALFIPLFTFFHVYLVPLARFALLSLFIHFFWFSNYSCTFSYSFIPFSYHFHPFPLSNYPILLFYSLSCTLLVFFCCENHVFVPIFRTIRYSFTVFSVSFTFCIFIFIFCPFCYFFRTMFHFVRTIPHFLCTISYVFL